MSDPRLYTHPADRSAMDALKAIPAFPQLMKAYMDIWNERQMRIVNMSSNLRLSEKQMPEIYSLLPPICQKLGIEIPELYLEQNVVPNAYTYGDTKPFIVLTTGLLKTMPRELLPTVIAHECGHIACRHTLYLSMGRLVLQGTAKAPGLAALITIPLQTAFAYWMRCSEFSADRAAAIYNGSADNMIEVCMRFAGFDLPTATEANVEAFLDQAVEYRSMLKDSKWDKTLEFLLFANRTHPLNAVRALECREWANSDQFIRTETYLATGAGKQLSTSVPCDIPIFEGSRTLVGRNYIEVETALRDLGFTDITLTRITEPNVLRRPGMLTEITANGLPFNKNDWLAPDAVIRIAYYEPLSISEEIALHPGEMRVPTAARLCIGRNYHEVVNEFSAAGFTIIQSIAQPDLDRGKLFQARPDTVADIEINGLRRFEKGSWFKPNAIIKVFYHTYLDGKPNNSDPLFPDLSVLRDPGNVLDNIGKALRGSEHKK